MVISIVVIKVRSQDSGGYRIGCTYPFVAVYLKAKDDHSTTTSLMVPLAGSGVFSLEQIYPFTLGANIGTCITALLAATAVSGAEAVPALEIAMVHLLYNTLGVIIIYGIP